MLLQKSLVDSRRARVHLAGDSETSEVRIIDLRYHFTELSRSRISLNTITLQIETTFRVIEATKPGEVRRIIPTVYTSQGVPISVTGIAQVKVQGQNKEMLMVKFHQA